MGGSKNSNAQREQLELEIASRLSEANSFEEQATFEALLYGSKASEGPNLKNATAAIEEIYAACLPWIREQTSDLTSEDDDRRSAQEVAKPLVDAMETFVGLIEQPCRKSSDQNQSPIDQLVEEKDLGSRVNYHSDSLEELIGAVREFQILASGREEAQPT